MRLGARVALALVLAALALFAARAAIAGPAPAVFVLEDRGRTWTIDDVTAPPLSERFQPLDPRRANVGFSASAYWVRFTLEARAATAEVWVVEAFRSINYVDLYARAPDGRFERRISGSMRPFSQREVRLAGAVFRVELAPGEARTLFLRLEGDHALHLSPALSTETAFVEKLAGERILDGAYYGLLLAMVLYNLFVFAAARDPATSYYVVFQAFCALGQASFDLVTFQYLWPEHPELAARSELFFLGAVAFAALGFGRRFLDTRALLPRADRALAVLAALACVLVAASTLTSHTLLKQTGLAFLAVTCAALIGAGAVSLARGAPNAAIFLAAWLVILAGSITEVAAIAGVLPAWILGTSKLGSAIEAMLLLLALARRMDRVRRDGERLQIELAESRLAYAQTLERKVEERTQELAEAQARMVRQARMAALGHLVAGVAHEIGNPLNFGAGGVEELSRRLQDIEDAQDDAPRARKALTGAQRAARLARDGLDRIRKIVDNLRGYAGQRALPPRPTDLAAELDAALALVGDRLERRSIRVVRAVEALPEIPATPGELGQVFMNLILNSYLAMPDGGEIRVEARRSGDRVEVVFRDTGPGIPEEHRDAIFDAFFTTRAPGEGTGLGLYVSHEIVARQGGQLRLLESDTGAAFVITLPVTGHE